MTDLTSASPIASTVPIDRTPVATAETPLTFRAERQRSPLLIARYTHRRSLWWASVAVAGSVIALVARSRVRLGVHWTSDVVASLALGHLAFNAVEAWRHRSTGDNRSPCRRRAELLPEVGPVIPALQPITRSDDR
jgi:hypothetical protein